MAAATLSVLACSACGAQVAIAREQDTRCTHCGQAVHVPEAYRTALAIAQGEIDNDRLTSEAFRKLGTPPSWPLVAVDWITSGVFGVGAMLLLTLIVGVKLVGTLFDHAVPWFHVNAWDWFSSWEKDLVTWGAIFLMLLTLFVLGAFGRRRAAGMRRLHRALAAKPPAREGGPSLCRDCGAPLTIPVNALGVRCTYCKCDNLVAIPEDWLARAKGAVEKVARAAKDALAVQRRELRALRVRLAVRLSIIVVLGALIMSSSVRHVVKGSHEGAFDLQSALAASPRRLFDLRPRAHLPPSDPVGPNAPRFPADGCDSMYLLTPGEDLPCAEGNCLAGWFVPLRKGETFELGSKSSGDVFLFMHVSQMDWDGAYGASDLWGTQIGREDVAPGHNAKFRAPITAWYRVVFEVHHAAPGKIDVCSAIH